MQGALLMLFLTNNLIIYVLASILVVAIVFALLIFTSAKKFKFNNTYYNILFNNVESGIFLCAKDDLLTLKYFNNSFISMLGYTREELKAYHSDKLINIISKDDLGFAFKSMYEQLSVGDNFELKVRFLKKDNTFAWVLWKGVKSKDTKNEYLSCVILNITDYMFSEKKQKIDEERYRIVAESSDSIIYEYNIKDKTIFYTNKYKVKFGEEPLTENYPDSFIDNGKIHKDDIKKFLTEYNKILYGKPSGSIEIRIKKASGEFIWCEMRYTSIFDEKGIPIRVIGKYIDIDKVKIETENLKKANQLDSFTGLYNKTAILANVERYLSENGEKKHAIFFIDIDNFKAVNDNYGHLYGDKLLLKISDLIKGQFRHSDLIGRIGGDEFLILVKDYIDQDFIHEKAKALCNSIEALRGEENNIIVTASIGITFFPDHGSLLASLYEKADIALYAAKSAGRNKYKIYSQKMSAGFDNSGKLLLPDSIKKIKISDYTEFLYEISNDIYNSADDIDNCINKILNKYGNNFSVDRIYIYEFNCDSSAILSYQWNSENTDRLSENFKIKVEKDDYEKNFNADNIFYCKNAKDFKSLALLYGEDKGIMSFLQCKIVENGIFKGFIGYDICNDTKQITREEIESLIFIAKALENILSCRRIKQINNYKPEQKKQIINSVNYPVFVTDAEKHSILYTNKHAEAFKSVKTGCNIFSVICENKQCEDCSLKVNNNQNAVCDKYGMDLFAVKTIWDNKPSIVIYDKSLKPYSSAN